MAEQLIGNLTESFDPSKYTDDYRENLLKIIRAKMKGKKIEAEEPEEPEATDVVDLMARLQESLERGHEEQRRLRPELPGGIGGQTRHGGLKCLHAHAAFALARPGYELGERILAEVEPLWPERCCSD